MNAVLLVNQTKEIWRDFTRFAIISKPNIQITQDKNPVEANYIAYHIIVNFFKTDIQLSQKNAPLMMHFYWHTLYSPQSTKVLLGYVVMYAKIYIWAKWDLGTLGGKYSFLQIYTDFVQIGWISLNGTAMQLDIEVSLWPQIPKSMFPFIKNTGYIMVTFLTQLGLKNTMPFLSVPSQL